MRILSVGYVTSVEIDETVLALLCYAGSQLPNPGPPSYSKEVGVKIAIGHKTREPAGRVGEVRRRRDWRGAMSR